MLKTDEKIFFPPRSNHFNRNEWNLLYDPLNVVWIRVNRDGMKILDAIRKAGTIKRAVKILANELHGETPGNIEKVITPFINNLVDTGYLHVGEYRKKERNFYYQEAPTEIYMTMTYQCNLKCRYCYNEGDRAHINESSDMGPELSIDEYTRLLDEGKHLGVKRFLFTGGEPLLNPNTLPVAKCAKKKGLETELISNGLLIDTKNVNEIVNTFDYISISLDSMNRESHEKMRGKGTFDKVLKSIRLLKEAGGTVRANSVITKVNVREMLDTWRGALEELKCDLYTPSLYAPDSQEEALFSDLLPEIDTLLQEQQRVREYYNTTTGTASKSSQFRFSCGIANGEIGISYDGYVYPCHLLLKPELKCGNLREKSLGKILKESALLKKLREFNVDDIPTCRDCDYKYLCGGGCLAMTYNVYGDFHRTNNFYCQYLKQERIERMWTSTVLDISGNM